MSIHQQLSRIRKPRVHITYDVETEQGQTQKELPFVIGVMGDFAAQSLEPFKPPKDRKFTVVDRDNLDAYMKNLSPGLQLRVKNTLKNDESEIMVSLLVLEALSATSSEISQFCAPFPFR